MAIEILRWKTEANDGGKISGEFSYDFPETLEACVEKFGAETVRLGFKKAAVIYLQAWARREATKEENAMSVADIALKGPEMKVSFSEREYVDPVEKALATLGKLGDEEKARLLASLKEMVSEAPEAAGSE